MLKRKAKRRVVQQQDVIKIYDDNLTDCINQGMGHNVPPLINHVAIYFLQQNLALPDAKSFYQHHEKMEWKIVSPFLTALGWKATNLWYSANFIISAIQRFHLLSALCN